MTVSRGKFLKSLGKSIPGMVLGGGVATAAHKILDKMAAVSGTPEASATSAEPELTKAPRIDFIRNGPPDGNRIALTFDDGPLPGATNLILDELKRRNVHASFFMIGRHIAAEPDLARRVLAEGHDACNHSYTHPNLTTLPDSQVEEEIQKTQDIMGEVLNHCAVWFRPPYGAFRRNQAGILEKAGLRSVLWNVDTADWSQPGEDKIIGTVLEQTKPGSIILCHDVHQQTVNSIGPILDGLLARGFLPVTLSTLLG